MLVQTMFAAPAGQVSQQEGTSQQQRVKYYSLEPGTARSGPAGEESGQSPATESGRVESAPAANLKRLYEENSSSEDERPQPKRRG